MFLLSLLRWWVRYFLEAWTRFKANLLVIHFVIQKHQESKSINEFHKMTAETKEVKVYISKSYVNLEN